MTEAKLKIFHKVEYSVDGELISASTREEAEVAASVIAYGWDNPSWAEPVVSQFSSNRFRDLSKGEVGRNLWTHFRGTAQMYPLELLELMVKAKREGIFPDL